MTRNDIFEAMLEIAGKIYDRVEITNGDFKGGECTVRGQKCFFINNSYNIEAKLRMLASNLSSKNTEDIFMLPKVRDAIERFAD